MADLMRVGSSFTSKNQTPVVKQAQDPGEIFGLQDVTRMEKPAAATGTEDRGSNNSFNQQQSSPTLLMGLLKDPAVTVTFLKNISMMQQLIKLLPVTNNPITAEVEVLFNSLLVAPGDITAELLTQEQNSTSFKGPLFDFLRQMLGQAQEGDNKTAQDSILQFLKALSSHATQKDVVGASANSLQFLGESFAPSTKLSEALLSLSERFRNLATTEEFLQLKKEIIDIQKNIQNSLLYSQKAEKIISILNYNLSRYNTNQDSLLQSTEKLLAQFQNQETKSSFIDKVNNFLQEFDANKQKQTSSKIMDVLTKIIGKQAQSEEIAALGGEKIEKIIQSLLSSPCNFTPLLHYVIPVEHMDIKAFAEMWINPNGENDQRNGEKQAETIHMLVVFDIENIGRFETELYAKGKTLDISVLCPPHLVNEFKPLIKRVAKQIAENGYRLGEVIIDKLERTHSLMEIFKSLPYKRTGVDVKI